MSWKTGSQLTFVEAIGDFALKQAATTDSVPLRVFGIAWYAFLGKTLADLLRSGQKLSILNAYWDATSNVLTYCIGWLWFGEKLSKRQHLGFALTLLGGTLLSDNPVT